MRVLLFLLTVFAVSTAMADFNFSLDDLVRIFDPPEPPPTYQLPPEEPSPHAQPRRSRSYPQAPRPIEPAEDPQVQPPPKEEPGYLRGEKPTTKDYYKSMMEQTLFRVSKVGQLNTNCPACVATAGLENSNPSPECQKTYNDFYKIKPQRSQESSDDLAIDVRISLGYMDDGLLGGDEVDDFYAAPLIRDQLLQPCTQPGVMACGFEQEPDDASLFRKRIEMMGPDGHKRYRYVRVSIYRSSASPSNAANNSQAHKKEQEEISESAREFFKDSLQNGDMVLYIGHARGGGGPDFAPPKMLKKPNTIDLTWYRKNHPGNDLMYSTLQQTKTHPKMIGIFACYARDVFRDGLKQTAPRSGLVLSGNNEFFSSVGQALVTLDSVLARRCEKEFQAALEIPKSLKLAKNIEVGPVLLDNVFKPASPTR